MAYNQLCIDQLNLALKLNPKQSQANDLLKTMEDMELIKPLDSGLDYLLLTPQTQIQFAPTPGIVTQTIAAATAITTRVMPTTQPTEMRPIEPSTPPNTQTSAPATPKPAAKPGTLPLCGGFLALGGFMLLLTLWRLK
jgi:hypothetical protein